MPTTFLLARHGETAWNREKIFRGAHDVPLNKNGRTQAARLAQALASRCIDVAYCSPLSRATETARIVLDPQRIQAVVNEDLRDFDYGEWTGLQDELVARRWPEEHRRWLLEPHTVCPPGGDTLQEVFGRAFGALEEIARQHAGETVALFAHRVVNKLLVLGVLGLGLERFPLICQDNCCVNEFQRTERGYVVITLNDTAHIRRSGTDLLMVDF